MTKSDIGLKLLSLYRDITKSYHNSECISPNNLFKITDTSKVEGMATAILSALDKRNLTLHRQIGYDN